jgi:hypothetical protein
MTERELQTAAFGSTSAGVSDGPTTDTTSGHSDQECAEFQALMSERIGAGEDLHAYPHMQSCDRCRALISDLEYMAKAIRDMIKPVEQDPTDDLWTKISRQLEREDS